MNNLDRVRGIEPSFPTFPGKEIDFTREKWDNDGIRWISTYSQDILGARWRQFGNDPNLGFSPLAIPRLTVGSSNAPPGKPIGTVPWPLPRNGRRPSLPAGTDTSPARNSFAG